MPFSRWCWNTVVGILPVSYLLRCFKSSEICWGMSWCVCCQLLFALPLPLKQPKLHWSEWEAVTMFVWGDFSVRVSVRVVYKSVSTNVLFILPAKRLLYSRVTASARWTGPSRADCFSLALDLWSVSLALIQTTFTWQMYVFSHLYSCLLQCINPVKCISFSTWEVLCFKSVWILTVDSGRHSVIIYCLWMKCYD